MRRRLKNLGAASFNRKRVGRLTFCKHDKGFVVWPIILNLSVAHQQGDMSDTASRSRTLARTRKETTTRPTLMSAAPTRTLIQMAPAHWTTTAPVRANMSSTRTWTKVYSFPEIQDLGSASTPPPSKERTKLPEMNHDVYRIIYRHLWMKSSWKFSFFSFL